MDRKYKALGLIALTLSFFELHAFVNEPWLRMPYQFAGTATYRYQFFDTVQNGINPTGYHSHENLVQLDLILPYAPDGEVEIEAQFNETGKNSFNFESAALQLKRQLLNDIAGDPISLMLGANARYVTGLRLHDVVTPYHNLFNFELLAAIGKEFARRDSYNNGTSNDWLFHFFMFGAAGFANTGSPWIRGLIEAQTKLHHSYVLRLFTEGYFGLGSRTIVNVDHFDSYATIAHQSIDVGGSYTYLFQVNGCFTLKYAYRVYAKSYPEHANLFTFSYIYPF